MRTPDVIASNVVATGWHGRRVKGGGRGDGIVGGYPRRTSMETPGTDWATSAVIVLIMASRKCLWLGGLWVGVLFTAAQCGGVGFVPVSVDYVPFDYCEAPAQW